jgi:hypothetical protein
MSTIALNRAPNAVMRPAQRPALASAATPPRASWLERLAIWAERQPVHRRLGSWTAL